MTDCLIADSRSDGFQAGDQGLATFDHCTIVRNFGWGIPGPFKFSANVITSVIEDNRGDGYYSGRFGSCGAPEASITGSVFSNKGKHEVKIENSNTWDFSSNYWGPKMTAELKKNGPDGKMSKISDFRNDSNFGRVNLDDYLADRPRDCGARELPKFR